jgi:hypothetical protein
MSTAAVATVASVRESDLIYVDSSAVYILVLTGSQYTENPEFHAQDAIMES